MQYKGAIGQRSQQFEYPIISVLVDGYFKMVHSLIGARKLAARGRMPLASLSRYQDGLGDGKTLLDPLPSVLCLPYAIHAAQDTRGWLPFVIFERFTSFSFLYFPRWIISGALRVTGATNLMEFGSCIDCVLEISELLQLVLCHLIVLSRFTLGRVTWLFARLQTGYNVLFISLHPWRGGPPEIRQRPFHSVASEAEGSVAVFRENERGDFS